MRIQNICFTGHSKTCGADIAYEYFFILSEQSNWPYDIDIVSQVIIVLICYSVTLLL
jgi:hypothetical protein